MVEKSKSCKKEKEEINNNNIYKLKDIYNLP